MRPLPKGNLPKLPDRDVVGDDLSLALDIVIKSHGNLEISKSAKSKNMEEKWFWNIFVRNIFKVCRDGSERDKDFYEHVRETDKILKAIGGKTYTKTLLSFPSECYGVLKKEFKSEEIS